MKQTTSIALFIGLLTVSHVANSQPDILDLEQQAQAITQSFAGQLRSVLKGTMVSAGPVNAIQVCKLNAPQMAQSLSLEKGWRIARTSSKVRNPNNQADLWEASVLQEWEEKLEKGAPLKNLKKSEIIHQNGEEVYRYMKAIPVVDVCLNCHGKHISGPVSQALHDLYPHDQATGYKKGQLRGAFTLQKSLNP